MLLQVKLTVKITAQQLQSESRPLLKVYWLNSDIASHKWWGKMVVFYLGAVHVAIKNLKERHTELRELVEPG